MRQRFLSNRIAPYLLVFAATLLGGFLFLAPSAHATGVEQFVKDTDGTLTTGLVSYYNMEGNSNDYWGSNDGSDTSIAYGTSYGKIGEGAYFDGGNGHSTVISNEDLALNDFSVSFWINTTQTDPYIIVFDGGGWWGASQSFLVQLNDVSGKLGFGIRNGGTVSYFDSSNTVNDGTWHNIVVISDGSYIRMYIDDVLDTSLSSSNLNVETNGNYVFGGRLYYSNATLQGDLDEIGIWSKVLSSQEIEDLYNSGYGDTMEIVSGPYISSLNQFKSDATTTIPDGATTTESTVVFGATLNSTTSDNLQLQVEVEPTSTIFTGIPNATSSLVSPGNFATTTFASSTGIDLSTYPRDPESWSNGSFHWQARVEDTMTGATSSWQMFGSTSTATDFIVQTLPLYTQESSNYPDSSDTTAWANAAYDDALPGTGCGQSTSTIAVCGCAITSVSMWLRYYGITTDASGTDVNPGTLNDWLETNSGYSSISGPQYGALIWNAVDGYAFPPGGGTISYDSADSGNYGTSSASYATAINNLLSSSTPDPVILYEANTPDGAATTTHFVVAIASSTYNGTSTYAIRDSYWYNTQYLNQPTSTGPGTVNFYNNEIDGIEVYYDPPQIPFWGQYTINNPDALMLVDSEGRRTGKDPRTGIIYREIPNTGYQEIASTPGHLADELTFSNLPKGQYTLYVLGGQTGPYAVDIANNQGQSALEGTVQDGSMVAYPQNYDPTNLASSTFSVSSTISSTASITTAPPNNWVPPPVQ